MGDKSRKSLSSDFSNVPVWRNRKSTSDRRGLVSCEAYVLKWSLTIIMTIREGSRLGLTICLMSLHNDINGTLEALERVDQGSHEL